MGTYSNPYPGEEFEIGPTITGKAGIATRFYDETNVDFIDILLPTSTTVTSYTAQKCVTSHRS